MIALRAAALLVASLAVATGGCPVAVTDNYTLAGEEGCADGAQGGEETDVDCGGRDCAACDAGDACRLPRDCVSASCQLAVCQEPTCSDDVANGSETDVDCGGPDCDWCLVGSACDRDTDCASGLCAAGACAVP